MRKHISLGCDLLQSVETLIWRAFCQFDFALEGFNPSTSVDVLHQLYINIKVSLHRSKRA